MITATQTPVLNLIEQYCDVLRTNFQSYSIQSHRNAIEKGENVEYHQKRIDELCEGVGVYDFTYEKGRKYARIVMHTESGSRSAHAFVDMKTGDVYKSASWKSPALNGVRYNLIDEKSRQEMYRRADWAGGYLYMR